MFIVMSLLGPDLAKLRNEQIHQKFTLPSAVRVATQTLNAIYDLHCAGFLSRDIKPGNFAIGNREEELHRMIFMFDFGISRKYVDELGNVLPARKDPVWRGTTRYSSLRAHLRQDLARKDDLESWFYAIVELTKGSVPSRLVVDRPNILHFKMIARGDGRKEFLSGCPKFYDEIFKIIDGLTFEEEPPYGEILKYFDTFCNQNNISMDEKYDWEGDQTRSLNSSFNNQSIERSPSFQVKAVNIPGEGRIQATLNYHNSNNYIH